MNRQDANANAITPAWTKFRPHAVQHALWRTRARFVSVCAGRQSGKTTIAMRRIVRFLPVEKEWDDPRYFYGAPTWSQVELIAWEKLKKLVPPDWIKNPSRDISESDLTIRTRFGSTLHCIGLDKPHRYEGTQWDGGVLDESSDCKPGTYAKTFIPALAIREGWIWRIGVPKRFGTGAKEFKDFFDLGLTGTVAKQESYTWPSWDILTPEQIADAKTQLGEIDYAEQFGGAWQSPEGQIYYGWKTAEYVSSEAVYNANLKIYVGSDFNVSPMAWTLGHKINGKLIVFDEIWLTNTNTPKTLDVLFGRYGTHTSGWRFIGDATGRARKSAAVATDYTLIKNDQRFIDKEVRYPKANPLVADRYANVNALCSRGGLLVNPKCVHLIDDLESRAYIEGTREADNRIKTAGHITDALGYVIVKEFPLRLNVGAAQTELAFE